MTDWLLTIPKTIPWSEYQQELDAVKDRSGVLAYRLYPANSNGRGRARAKGVQPGDRCFIVWNGAIRGWQEIVGMRDSQGFRCQITDRWWPSGIYLIRSGPFHRIKPISYRGFRGIRRLRVDGKIEELNAETEGDVLCC